MSNWVYIVLVGAVVLVFALLVPRKKETAADSNQAVRNMEVALEQFMENMEMDNQELVKLVAATKESERSQSDKKEQRINELESKLVKLEQLLEQQRQNVPAIAVSEQPAAVVTPEMPVQQAAQEEELVAPPSTIGGRYASLLELYSQGKSIEAIAKKMGMNKGEVQLILQLVKREEGLRA